MKLEFIMLAQHAEASGNLLNMTGGGWDTLRVTDLPESTEGDGVQIPMPGVIVARIRFHNVEVKRKHTWHLTVLDMDGQRLAGVEGTADLSNVGDLPVHWDHFANLIIDLPPWLPLNNGVGEQHYVFSLQVNDAHVGDVGFRILRDTE